MESVLTSHQANDRGWHSRIWIVTSGLLQCHVADEARVVRMTRFGDQLTVGHDTRVHVAGGTQALVTGVP